MVVTGAASGIGRALVDALLERGARVAAVDLRPEALEALPKDARISTHVADIGDRPRVAELPAEVLAAHGCVDILINNAGIIQPFVPLADLDEEVIDRVMRVNFRGPVDMIRSFLPHLRTRSAAHICNVSSMGGFMPVPGQTIYGASKAAVKLMSEGLYAELLDTTVGVSVVMPGGVETPITENSHVARPVADADQAGYTLTTPERAARVICKGIESDDLHILIGKDAKLLYAASKLAPKAAIRMIQRKMKSMIGL